jgi:E3 ubiquitin-protein ligase HUWE1
MAASAQRRPQTNSYEPDVNGEWLQQLMDMGFTREHCVEALLHTPNVEQATDYLLSNPSPFACTTQVAVKSSF